MKELYVPTHRRPSTPGVLLLEEFLRPLGITQVAFAKRIGVTPARLNEIIKGKRAVTADTALRLSRALGTSAEMWINAQKVVDLYDTLHSPAAKEIRKIRPLKYPPAA